MKRKTLLNVLWHFSDYRFFFCSLVFFYPPSFSSSSPSVFEFISFHITKEIPEFELVLFMALEIKVFEWWLTCICSLFFPLFDILLIDLPSTIHINRRYKIHRRDHYRFHRDLNDPRWSLSWVLIWRKKQKEWKKIHEKIKFVSEKIGLLSLCFE